MILPTEVLGSAMGASIEYSNGFIIDFVLIRVQVQVIVHFAVRLQFQVQMFPKERRQYRNRRYLFIILSAFL